MEYQELTIESAATLLSSRQISSFELTSALLDRIEKYDDEINAFITVDKTMALEQAKKADQDIAADKILPLTGVPLALKDLLCTNGIRTTCGSQILNNFIPQYDGTIVKKLKENGAVIIGKTNLDEFGMGSSTENSSYKITTNPWNKAHVPGGSSGGSAAAVSAGFCCAALGTDTGGSIRQPSSHCGVVGLKPTYGRVSRFGLVSYASSLDQIGPITKNVKDAAILLNTISGNDEMDSTSAKVDVPDFTKAFDQFEKDSLKGMTAGIPKEYLCVDGIDPEVENIFNNAKEVFKDLGVKIKEISLPHTDYVVAAYYIIAPSEASSNLARFDGVKYGFREKLSDDLIDMYKKTRSKGFGPEVQRRIMIGTYALSAGYYDAYYGRASQVRTLIVDDFSKAFRECDFILSPVAPAPAFKIGENMDDPLTMYLTDIFTLSANMAGIPGISVPAGFSSKGLPIGIQMMGKSFDELSLLRAGYGFEKTIQLAKTFPDL
ncbi:MAG: Asp-tRNA(Asn)/Glu-tRNA(Gln) amidotransferase subunit GatA [Desulfobacula sp.]|jgi:aspartyl-tRNA(Asn)/glutamyl-tRNA(Gln) amidotransferase subunit A|uniref:Asp-tRNA(Asn)/Glu-tRNA(Gln) amidotransferase subunit GatA n=1 Tax=Desulfobacula sp. TaxID=2593537 RepID=UPI001D97827B|nr:Asp-tRNA(Asn)/Glu-tRNA(Gln) amidotransferase subunit GatA [Desulfobacula sp.]MBT3485261.1 Asp-tRNA(Asn)/Glu-tRNA(Gln) amidotransferase subunit GatA [Desulfobacula sp.]MBT3804732.1 Asp-tRNA(Asn)/Glu-tRNA(Gln) amidotransferase subunit GatA [Desulfobacula sp.]MBT4025210.1 Asp-tRNA(Asn)/Glu-tRNA(Gln) amidotransferase subunit GatA [Desulfobacula sp.]MBT4200666.1 Asp-tRNA(Asn)/Glu-tRNA(Gln) amidotransferase subunit GatA [Desulfobacula sp.]